ncbi:cytochrome B561 [Roseibacterium elongatum DSM 19469]|uniref:Cytochrome B561 n=1 Tax=Roseicyclus elongatus DSM 19469 TaxID=1294273 RepID=W8RYR7_9RHOB|nr:cytochrome b [Roseibacterium elongatum]AHM02992.1 cytochrome B561 [Roseibacterium elongatum DSM 19469]
MPNPDTRYRRTARLIHWAMAILVLGMIPAGVAMVQPGIERSVQNALFLFHKNVGVVLLLLIVLRALYRWRHPPAPLPGDLPAWQHRAAGVSHVALYALLFLVPIAGYIRVMAGGFPIETLDWLGVPSLVPRSDALAEVAKTVHYFGGIALALLIATHIAAAAYHGIIRRDGVFSRMWPPFAKHGG